MLVLLFDACRVMRPCPTAPAIPQAACCSRWQGASAPPGAASKSGSWRSLGTGAGAAPEGEKGCFLLRTDAVAALSAGCPSVALMLRIRARSREKPQCAARRRNEELGQSATQWHAGRSHRTSAQTSWHRREGPLAAPALRLGARAHPTGTAPSPLRRQSPVRGSVVLHSFILIVHWYQ